MPRSSSRRRPSFHARHGFSALSRHKRTRLAATSRSFKELSSEGESVPTIQPPTMNRAPERCQENDYTSVAKFRSDFNPHIESIFAKANSGEVDAWTCKFSESGEGRKYYR